MFDIIITRNFKLNFIFLIIQILTSIKSLNNDCSNGKTITDESCFSGLIINPEHYRAAQFITDKEGNMIIEYSKDSSGSYEYRLFYGLKKNGRNYFENEQAHKILKIETNEGNKGRYEARNILIYLKDDHTKSNEYLFSTSAYDTLTELYEFKENNIVNYKVKGTRAFWDIIDIFSYQYSLMEWRKNNENIYFCVFTQHETDKIKINGEDKDYSMTITIKKFALNSFDLENYEKIETKSFRDNFNNRIVSSFIFPDKEILALFYMKSVNNAVKSFIHAKFAVKFYDFDLNEKNEIFLTTNDISDPRNSEGVFFKGLYLKEDYAALLYYVKGLGNTIIQFDVSQLIENNGEYSFSKKIDFQNTYGYISDITTNEFIKINDERLAFFTTKKISGTDKYELHISLFDLYNNYEKMKIRAYYFNLDKYKLSKELTAYVFNDFLIFSSTTEIPPNYNNYYSALLFFGYPNGTDHIIDISPYLMDTDFHTTGNIFNYLTSVMVIENNIFHYENIGKINLLSIPEELLFYNITSGVKDENPLPNDTFFDANHILHQNKQLNKTFRYYHIDYQYIVKEPDYDTFYSTGNTILTNYPSDFDSSSDYNANRKIFYGRVNRIKFKLCYDFCGSCVEFGKDINDQKCFTCLENYTYDYWAYLGKYIPNCVPENMYFDLNDTNTMINCDNTFDYLYDYNNNEKKICFKSDKECPKRYSNYNESTKECEYTPEVCNFDSYYNNECNFLNYSESEALNKMKEIIDSYPKDNTSLSTNLGNGTSLEITNDRKEKLFMDDTELPWIDLAECGNKLRAVYRNNSDEPLIIIKYGKTTGLPYEKELEYEVYDPDTYKQLNLSICNDSDVNIYIKIPLKDEFVNALKNIIAQGYDPFDITDKFYREICTPYDSENGTDVLLDSREEYYYSSINTIVCPDNCHNSSFDLDSRYLKCECDANYTGITLNLKHITGKNIKYSFYDMLKNSNWKVMICYNLVFNWEIFQHNSGSIISLIFFLIYLGFIVYYAFRGTEPIQIEISKIRFKENKNDNEVDNKNDDISIVDVKNQNKIKNKNRDKKVKIKYPPKKGKSKTVKMKAGATALKDSETKLSSFNAFNKRKGEKLMTNPGKSKNNTFKNKVTKELIYTEGAILNKKGEKAKIKKEEEVIPDLDNFELNNLEYIDAVKFDKRPFLTTYWSVLMREHIVLFTFLSWNDYNIFYIKIERFLVLICTQMAMNGLFFSDESMHKANNDDNYNFVQQLPKIIFSLIATHIIEVVLCFLSMTDTTYYKIKKLSKDKQNDEKIINEIKCMKRKLIGFYVFTFLLFLFYWYFISAFCAVYQNTQKTFILDSFISIVVQFIDPFFIYCFTTLLRYISLTKCANKNMECLYKTSDLIPIF